MSNEIFSGKVAVITGAANGIGLATVARFAEDGADIVAVDLSGAPLGNAVATGETVGRRVVPVEADVSQPSDWANVVTQAVEQLGRIDILINCAGISGPLGRFEDVPVEAFDQVMAVNVRGIFLGMQAVVPTMKAQGSGHIVNVSSISGERGNGRVSSYVTSKHAVNGLTKSAAVDLIEYGIYVNAVSPSPIDTAMMRKAEEAAAARLNVDMETARKMMSAGSPIGRYGQPAEIAAAMAFLCTEAASFMVGAIVPVDGGSAAR